MTHLNELKHMLNWLVAVVGTRQEQDARMALIDQLYQMTWEDWTDARG